MTSEERDELKDLVRESCQQAIHDQLPEMLTEELAALMVPSIRKTVREVLKPFRRAMVAAYILLFLAVVLLYAANRHRTQEIQDSRQEVCEGNNTRHDNTIKTLNAIIDRAIRDSDNPKEKRDLAQNRASNILLINALVPKQDCQQVVK